MTNREFLNVVIESAISDELTDHAKALLAQMDKRNAKRAATPSKTAVANAPIKEQIMNLLADGGKTASEVGVALELTTQKASALLRQLVADERLTQTEVKVKGKGKVKYYSITE